MKMRTVSCGMRILSVWLKKKWDVGWKQNWLQDLYCVVSYQNTADIIRTKHLNHCEQDDNEIRGDEQESEQIGILFRWRRQFKKKVGLKDFFVQKCLLY